MNKLYYQQDNGAVYIHLDGGLRHVPDVKTYKKLFNFPIIPDNFIQFPNEESAPIKILKDWPIVPNAIVITVKEFGNKLFLIDKYPWASYLIIRPIVSEEQMDALGFGKNLVQKNFPREAPIGVPLAIDTYKDVSDVENLVANYNLYGYLILGDKLNPYFTNMLKKFPGYGKPGTDENQKFKKELKNNIIEYVNLVNALPEHL
ncbi:hypothetical protein [Aureivirga marina]|uniref:hypothetical protein n=1 Tax=Aureivirga marina TaxID=1182451 RepID=UPI0018CB420B|nr:hypothetical protein [Aureivirga marina]